MIHNKHTELLDDTIKGFVYGEPQPNYKDSLITYQTFFKDMNDYRIKQRQYNDFSV